VTDNDRTRLGRPHLKLGARYYNPTTGRFTQPDPSGQEANTYNYASCNPANRIDPTGLSWRTCGLTALGYGADMYGLGAAMSATGVGATVGVWVAGVGFVVSATFFVEECFPDW